MIVAVEPLFVCKNPCKKEGNNNQATMLIKEF